MHATHLARELLFRARNRLLLVVQQFLDPQSHLDVTPAISALSGAILLRRKHWEFCFPVTQYVRLDSEEIAHFANLKKKLFRYDDAGWGHIKCPSRRADTLALAPTARECYPPRDFAVNTYI